MCWRLHYVDGLLVCGWLILVLYFVAVGLWLGLWSGLKLVFQYLFRYVFWKIFVLFCYFPSPCCCLHRLILVPWCSCMPCLTVNGSYFPVYWHATACKYLNAHTHTFFPSPCCCLNRLILVPWYSCMPCLIVNVSQFRVYWYMHAIFECLHTNVYMYSNATLSVERELGTVLLGKNCFRGWVNQLLS